MNKRRKPTKLKLLEGNPGHQKLEPEPEPGPMGELKSVDWKYIKKMEGKWEQLANDEYKRMGAKLKALGLLTEIDDAALMAYSTAYAKWSVAEAISGVKEKNCRNNYFQIAKHYVNIMHKFIVEFGMTPSARARIHVPEQDKGEDELENMLSDTESRKSV